MKSFTCTIRDKEGLHARPAGLLAAAAKKYAGTNVTIAKGDKSGDAKKIFKIMSLARQRDHHRRRSRRGRRPGRDPRRAGRCGLTQSHPPQGNDANRKEGRRVSAMLARRPSVRQGRRSRFGYLPHSLSL